VVSVIRIPFAGSIDQGTAGTGTVGLSTITVGAGRRGVRLDLHRRLLTSMRRSTAASPSFRPISLHTGTAFNYVSTQVKTDSTLPDDQFRTLPTHVIAADPTRPGVLYAVAENAADQLSAGAVAASGIVFAVSYDYGQDWTSNFVVGSEGLRAASPID